MSKAWMPFYVADYLADTNHLNAEQHGSYMLCLFHYWQTEQPLTANAEQLQMICKTFDVQTFNKNWAVISKLFTKDGDCWRSKRMDKEILKAKKLSSTRSKVAKKRYEKPPAKAPAIALHLHTQSQSHKDLISEIVQYMNKVSGKNFSMTAQATIKHINARIDEGYAIDSFKNAIDNQWREWSGTDMEKYFRPQTLFNSEKFDGYVNNTSNRKCKAEINNFI